MLAIESNSVNSGTEVLIEMFVLSDMFPKHTVFHQMKTANVDSNIYCCQKCELTSYKVIDYKHNVYNRDLSLFYFYTVQYKNL